MKNFRLISTLFLISIFSVYGQTTKKVLFIGNSYTYYYNLPNMVHELSDSAGDELIYDSSTQGDAKLSDHDSNSAVHNKINSNTWDYVVLQAHSRETSNTELEMETNLYPYAESLVDAIRDNYECSRPMFYMTWGRENGDALRCSEKPWVCTYEGMDAAVEATYNSMADTYDTEISPVGAVWRYVRENHPSIDLYDPDGSHPSLIGTYLIACTFYSVIFKKDPTLITSTYTFPIEDANNIKQAAKTIAFDHLATWDFTVNPAMADYSEVIDAREVTFTNTSDDFDSVFWDFGDANTSTDVNPVHIYVADGVYDVSLTVTKCGKSSTKTKSLESDNTLNLEKFNLGQLNIYPNPSSKIINVKLRKNYKEISAVVYDVTGKSVVKSKFQNSETFNMDISVLSEGIYILKVITDNYSYSAKIIKK